MTEGMCPWCGQTVRFRLTRRRPGATELECPECGRRHTRRPDEPGAAFAFFPEDISAAVVEDVPPLEC
jgi:hypothetical protein